MKAMTDYKEIVPKKKWFETLVTRVFFLCLGMGMQTAYRIDPDAKKEIDSLPETFSFRLAVVGGPSMIMLKKAGSFQCFGEKEVFYCDVELWFKNIEYAYLTMTGRMSVPNIIYHNRQFIKGNLKHMICLNRVMTITQSLLFPNFIARFYVKEVPKMTFKRLINMGITYFNVGYGAIK
ncbi:MAG: hypothetical protein NTW65_06045 [Deltaproteobacteria bacterium]|nr:hypothetical protein [Deltaproteobacteria bacterium]